MCIEYVYAEAGMERIQILLEEVERKALKQLASEAHTSMSDVVREMLRERIKTRKREQLRRAADVMASEYRTDPELTALSEAHFDEDLPDATH
jgi:Arc/MetJ-type ribon-helix-helix transcriptional regulator